jgi:hypothetical protein
MSANGTLVSFNPVLIAEARIWNVVRTQTEIQNNMFLKLDVQPSSLTGYWPCHDNSTTLTNLVSGQPDFTLYNSPSWVASTLPTTYSNNVSSSSTNATGGLDGCAGMAMIRFF